MVKRFSEFNPELGRLVVLLERKKSTSEHLLSPQSWSCTKDAAETGSAWKRTKSDLSQDLQVACRIYCPIFRAALQGCGGSTAMSGHKSVWLKHKNVEKSSR